MPRLLIYGYYGQGNAGDEAILSALIDGIRRELPNAHISVCSARPDETMRNFQTNAFRFFSLGLKPIIKGLLRKTRKDYMNAVISFFRSDVIIIGGGGLFFDNKETNRWIFGYLDLIYLAKKFGKKIALIGISVGPLHHKSSEDAIKNAFELADIISVRDHTSKELLVQCGLSPNRIHVIPDLVFTLDSENDVRISAILANESFPLEAPCNIALTPCCYNTEHHGWHQQYVTFCERVVTELDGNLWLIPMQRNDNYDDLAAIESIYSGLTEEAKKRTYILKGFYSAKEIQGIISKANFVLAERLHGSIMAVNTNTPVLSIAYMPKVVGVLELANLGDRIITNEDFLAGRFHEKFFIFYSSHMQSKCEPERIGHQWFAIAHQNFIRIKQLVTQ